MEGDPQWQEQGTGGTGFAVSEYNLNLRKKTYVARSKPLAIGGEELSAEQQLVDKIRQQRKMIEYPQAAARNPKKGYEMFSGLQRGFCVRLLEVLQVWRFDLISWADAPRPIDFRTIQVG